MAEKAPLLDLMEACWSQSSFFWNCSHGSGTGSTCQQDIRAKHHLTAQSADAAPLKRGTCIDDDGALPSLLDNWLQQLPPQFQYEHTKTPPILPMLSTQCHVAGAPPLAYASSDFCSYASSSITTPAPIQEAALASAAPSRNASTEYSKLQPATAVTAAPTTTEAAPIKRGTMTKANGLLGSMIFGMSMSAMDMLPGAGEDTHTSTEGNGVFELEAASTQHQAHSQPCEERGEINSLPIQELIALLRKHAQDNPFRSTGKIRQHTPEQQQQLQQLPHGPSDPQTGVQVTSDASPAANLQQVHAPPAAAHNTSCSAVTPDPVSCRVPSAAAIPAASHAQSALAPVPSGVAQCSMGQEFSFAGMGVHVSSAQPQQQGLISQAFGHSQLATCGPIISHGSAVGSSAALVKPVRVVGFDIRPELVFSRAI